MPSVAVRILHRPPARDAGPLEHRLAAMRLDAAARIVPRFAALGADAQVLEGDPAASTFGQRLRALIAPLRPDAGLVVLGSGVAPTATRGDLAPFVHTAASGDRIALANNRYSADLVAIGGAGSLEGIPDLPSDNALPRWLEEVAGYRVTDLRGRRRLQLDLDSPLDGALLGLARAAGDELAAVGAALARVRAVAADRRGEVVIAGRTSASMLRWAERTLPSRIRALVEERGLRASTSLALEAATPAPRVRPPRSVLGMLLDRDGPGAIGERLAELGDAALVDSRVLLAHRLGADEGGWPAPEDRYASDLLLPERIADDWLRELTRAALHAPIPIVLGGHTLVGPGSPLALRGSR